jgi:hypothetical protein
METTKKITRTTVKSFIQKNRAMLFVRHDSAFNGMSDMVETMKSSFKIAKESGRNQENTFGIDGAWFVGHSRDYFKRYEDADFTGIEVYNCCGSFILAVLK